MNWKQINEQYPLAFLEWAKHLLPNLSSIGEVKQRFKGWGEFSYGDGFSSNNQKGLSPNLVWQLPEYFDALGVHVGVRPLNEWDGSVFFAVEVLGKNGGLFSAIKEWSIKSNVALFQFPTRREALEAGVIKAFEIREEQLKQKEK